MGCDALWVSVIQRFEVPAPFIGTACSSTDLTAKRQISKKKVRHQLFHRPRTRLPAGCQGKSCI